MGQRFIYSIAALGFAIIVIGGGYYEVTDLTQRKPTFHTAVLTEQGWWNGQNMREISAFLKEESKVGRHVTPFYNELLFHVAGTSSTTIVAGTDMLFHRVRVQPRDSTFWKRQAKFTIDTCDGINQAMSTWGGRLAVLVVPDRIRAYPERLPSFDLDGSPKGPYYNDLQAGLRAKGILSIDFLKTIKDYHTRNGRSELLYRRDDHHWNPRGARLAVDDIVSLIKRELPQAETDLDLVVSKKEFPYRAGLARSMGWRKGSALWNRYADDRSMDVVETKKGRRYIPNWDEDIALVSDSFGLFGIAEQAALALKAPISCLAQAGRGSGPPMAQLMEQVKHGWRPRLIIWLMEEKGTYGQESPLHGWTPTATVDIPESGKTAIPVSRKKILMGKGVTLTGDDREFLMTTGLRDGAWFIPRTLIKGEEFSFYMKPIKPGLNKPHALLVDRTWQSDLEIDPYPGRAAMPNQDTKWHMVAMKKPKGMQALKLLFCLDQTFPKYFMRSLAYWVPANQAAEHSSPHVNRISPWKTESAITRRLVQRGTFYPTKVSSPPILLKVGSRHHRIWWTERTSEFVAEQPVPHQGTIRFLLGAGNAPQTLVPPKLSHLPIVASVYARTSEENSERMVHQQQFQLSDGPLQWKDVLLPLNLPEGPEWQLSVRFYIPAPLRGIAVAGFGSPK